MDMDWCIGSMNHGDEWRQRRKLYHRHYNTSAVQKYEGIILENVHRFLVRLRDRPERFLGHARLYVTSIQLIHCLTFLEQRICCDTLKCDLWNRHPR